MKLKSVAHLISMIAVLNLNACATAIMWGANSPFDTKYVYQDMGKDNVYAFGQAQQNSSQLEAGSLLMMGERYWYALDKNDAQQLLPILNAPLERQYSIHNHAGESLSALPVDMLDKGKKFRSHFCLRYTSQQAHEIQALTNLNFKTLDKQPEIHQRCFNYYGQVFAKPTSTTADYRFEQVVPVKLRLEQSKTQVSDKGKLVENIVATPVTLAIDAAATVVALPLAAIGGLASLFK